MTTAATLLAANLCAFDFRAKLVDGVCSTFFNLEVSNDEEFELLLGAAEDCD